MSLLTRPRVRQVRRYVKFGLSALAAILAVAVVGSLTLDLGPTVREYAERAGSQQLERSVEIGGLSVHLLTGRVLVEDIAIGGLHKGDRPFFTAKRLSVAMDWKALAARHPDVSITGVELTDWQMLVEKWEDVQSFPRLVRQEEPSTGPKLFTTTLHYLRASRGQFAFEDHETPWSIVCPNLDLSITNLPHYRGQVSFNGGTVTIQHYEPMWANMSATFDLDGPRVHLGRIDLDTDGATSVTDGVVDLGNFPDMLFNVRSRVRFPRMRQIFFKDATWDVSGDGTFAGTFHLFKGGHDLAGTFASDLGGLNAYRFGDLSGSLHWTRTGFDVSSAGAKVFGGETRFTYSISPLGDTNTQPTGRLDAEYLDLDLAAFTDFQQLPGLRFAGRASGHNRLEWPMGRFAERLGGGAIEIEPPPGTRPMDATLDPAGPERERYEWGPFAPTPLASHLPIAARGTYAFTADDVEIEGGRFATERTHVTFDGRTAWGDRSRLRFHVTSGDWQESDQVLAGIISAFGKPTGPVAFGGRGEFDGVMTGAFSRPRVEGTFTGEDLRAWDASWGAGTARIVYENSYIEISDSVVRRQGSEIRTDGRFSTQFPRDDGQDEIDARFRVTRYPIDGLRHAFHIDDYPLTGFLGGEFHLTGDYQRPIGFGSMTVVDGSAWNEPFQRAAASLRFDGPGVRLDGVEIAKATGSVTGAAFIGWDGTYSFNADGRAIPVDRLAMVNFPRAPLSGIAEFTASGSGTFESPRYDVKFRVGGLQIGEEGVGEVNGTLGLRGKELSGEIDAASPRLAITGTGRIALTAQADADLTFRFHDSSLDPYVRLFVPKLSPVTTAVASGSIRVVGELADFDHLLLDGTVDSLDLRLFDYALKNATPIRIAMDRRLIRIGELQIVGEDTRLRVSGGLAPQRNIIALQVSGDANLGILQGFFRNVRSSGRATLTAGINGPFDKPVFSGNATITNGRLRHFSLPASLDAINGTVRFDPRGIRLDDVTGTVGDGQVQFGGFIGFDGFIPSDVNVTARATGIHLRYPEGVRSIVDTDLAVRGNFKTPTLTGIVTVRSAVWTRRIDAPGSILDLAGRASPPSGAGGASEPPPTPLRFDLQILVPSTLRIDTSLLRMVASADLNLRGTYERPVLLGHADIERGEVTFEGRRYRVTRGTIDFTNPTRIEPFFDVAVETTVRVPGQTYRVNGTGAGTVDRLQLAVSSDPPLATADVLALLFGDARNTANAELRARQNPNERQTDILTARATQALASPLSSEVGKVVEQTFGLDTFQLSPMLIDPAQQTARVNPSARLTIGKRISDRAYLTFSRSLNSVVNDQVIVLEVEATDRISWLLSRNQDDQTYSLEFRVRHAF